MIKFNTMSKAFALFIAGSILFSSCASTTIIDSIPTGANLYLDGEFAGTTPHTMTDTKLLGTCTTVKIEKENYRSFYGNICRTEEADPGAIIGGIFFFFPFFWAMKYKPTHFYKLELKSGDDATNDQVKPNDDSLDQLWKSDSKIKDQKMSVEPAPDNKDGVLKLDEGTKITPEEFEKQKTSKHE
jgi:hypothetical protein